MKRGRRPNAAAEAVVAGAAVMAAGVAVMAAAEAAVVVAAAIVVIAETGATGAIAGSGFNSPSREKLKLLYNQTLQFLQRRAVRPVAFYPFDRRSAVRLCFATCFSNTPRR